ncbi:hypothetical protein ACPC54_24285 [Kitasatospora sp. NPDC094028]
MHDEDDDGLRSSDSDRLAVWPVDDRKLYLQEFSVFGDGDFEYQLWLAVAAV